MNKATCRELVPEQVDFLISKTRVLQHTVYNHYLYCNDRVVTQYYHTYSGKFLKVLILKILITLDGSQIIFQIFKFEGHFNTSTELINLTQHETAEVVIPRTD